MALIQTGRYGDLLRRVLSMSGVTVVASELAPEISPVFILEAERPEWEFLKGAKLATSQISVGGVAAQTTSARIRNPPNSGILAIFQLFQFSVENNATVLIAQRLTNNDLANVVATVLRDTRWPLVLNASALIASQTDNAGAFAGNFFYNEFALARTNHLLTVPFVLSPGFAIDIFIETVNVSCRGCFHWLERRQQPLEVE